MIEIIAFDADDTLWDNESLYSQAKGRFQEILSNYASPEAIAQILDVNEVHNIDVYGYGIKSFALSMVETAIELSQGQIAGGEIQQVIEIARGMLTAPVDLYEKVMETLEELSMEYRLMLITKGDRFEQERKIARSGLKQYFEVVEIVGDKSEASYQEMMARYSLQPDQFLMVGNSMRSDILPVLRLGGRAVYIPQENTWSHENVVAGSGDTGKHYVLEHLWQLPELLHTLEGERDETDL